jgi:hypothetical protein
MRTTEEVRSIIRIRKETGAGQQEAIAAYAEFGEDAILQLNSGWKSDEKIKNDEFHAQVMEYNREVGKRATSIRPAKEMDGVCLVCDKQGRVIGETVGFPNNDKEFDDLIQNYFFAY